MGKYGGHVEAQIPRFDYEGVEFNDSKGMYKKRISLSGEFWFIWF